MAESEHNEVGVTMPGHYGAAGTGVVLAPATVAAAWNVQGDPARASFVAQVPQLFGVALPLVPNTTASSGALSVLWLGPRSWLLIESASSGEAAVLKGFEARRDALNAQGGALFDVSASRVAYAVRGEHATTVLAKTCPLDFHPRAFPAGRCAQSVLGHLNALICKHDEAPTFTVMVARSLAADAWRGLCLSAAAEGYDVAPPAPFRIG